MSNIILDNAQKSALNKGLKYVPAPRRVSKDKIKEAITKFGRRVRIAHHFSHGTSFTRNKKFRLPSNWTPPDTPAVINQKLQDMENQIDNITVKIPKRNLTEQEVKGLEKLKKNSEIIIKPADKGSATVILDRDNYILEAERQLGNPKHYKQLKEPVFPETAEKFNQILNVLKRKGFLDEKQCEYLQSHSDARPRQLYLLPKIHKDPEKWTIPGKMPPGRPIISDCSSESYAISEYIDHFLAPLANKHPAYLKDTGHFLNEISKLKVPEDALLVTIDVDSLYTNIDNQDGMEAVKIAFQKYQDPSRPDTQILELLKLSLENNDFEFNGNWYLQTFGTAMGKKFAPNYANIFMAQWEEGALAKSSKKPAFYKRFLDDIKIIWTHGRAEFDKFFEILQNHHASISLKFEIHDSEINFLDTTVYKGERFQREGILDTKVYFKPTDSLQLLHKASYHPKHTFSGIVKSQILRYRRICNNTKDFEQACTKLFSALNKRGYSKRFLREIKSKTLKPRKTRAKGLSTKCGHVQCTICQFVRNRVKIEEHSLRTSQNCNSSHGVYLISCNKCGKKYVGETGNTFKKRMSRHISDIRLKKPTPVGTHFNQGQCTLLSLEIVFLETLKNTEKQYKNKSMRLDRERFWTQKLQTFEPHGLNKIPRPLERPVMPFVIPFSDSAIEISKIARDTFEQLKAIFPTKFPQTFVTAFSKNKSLKDTLVRSKFGNAPLTTAIESEIQTPIHQVEPRQKPLVIAIPRCMLPNYINQTLIDDLK